MGQTASRAERKLNGLVVTLDALGTLYKFRKPVAVQYLDIAQQAGVKHGIPVDQLQQAFKTAYKEQTTRHPNYGYGTLSDPSEWWSMLVNKTFSQIVNDVPETLPRQLYDHFSSADAYELHSDVQPFIQSMHNLRNQFSDPKGPALLTGVITNSDPRVSKVLRALSLKVGEVRIPSNQEVRDSAAASVQSGNFETPWSNAYDPTNDFDFVVTGYEAGAEKPSPKIWGYADFQASLVAISKSQKGLELPEGKFRSVFAVVANAVSNVGKTDNMQWIHIGDEYEKDYLGAKSVPGREALLLDRDNSMRIPVDRVSSLVDAATVVNLMAQEILNQNGGQ